MKPARQDAVCIVYIYLLVVCRLVVDGYGGVLAVRRHGRRADEEEEEEEEGNNRAVKRRRTEPEDGGRT